MLEKVRYSEDKKFLIFSRDYRDEPEQIVPVSFIDEIFERKLDTGDLEKLMTYREFTRNGSKAYKISDLVGMDLENKWVSFYTSNYDDSQWVTSFEIKTVVEDEDSTSRYPTFTFVNSEVTEACDAETCGHDGTDGNSCVYSDTFNFSGARNGNLEVFVGDIL